MTVDLTDPAVQALVIRSIARRLVMGSAMCVDRADTLARTAVRDALAAAEPAPEQPDPS